MSEPGFAHALLAWFDCHGRHDLPWQQKRADGSRDPYRVWLSEVMLQQTQVATVIAYFERFVAALPTLRALAEAEEDRVFALWSGLGYYRRARFLHRAARLCVENHGGELPRDFDALRALPGIGRSTAGAILAQAWGRRAAILDGNVKRVLTRWHGIHGNPGESKVERRLWEIAEANTPEQRVADYTQAIMDLGSLVCVRGQPRCEACPVAAGCIARRDGLTAQLPTRRTSREVPQRQTLMLVLRDRDGRVLLQRRGDSGVWSGLWSLPEAADNEQAWRIARIHAQLDDASALPSFEHAFSHYRLTVEPWLFDNALPVAHVGETSLPARWCTMQEIVALGVPAPVRSLLERLP